MTDETPTPDETATPEAPGADFSGLIYTIGMQALIFLGKQPHPETGKYERNIDVARYQIDTLEVLKTKTEGNRTDEETKLIDTLLHSCRMAFVDESEKES